MAERSKGFKIGAVCLFVSALGLLAFVLVNNNSDGPGVVAEELTAPTPTAPEALPEPTVVNAQATEEAPQPTDAPAEAVPEALTPEKKKKARSIMD